MLYEREQENHQYFKNFRHTDALRKCSSHRHRLVGDILHAQPGIHYPSSHRYHADVQPKTENQSWATRHTDANQISTQSTKTNASHKHARMESKLFTRVCLNVAGRDSRVEVAGAGAGAGAG